MTTYKNAAPLEMPRCTPSGNNGHCSLARGRWFARALSLERKRTERSRKPFVLALMSLEGVEALNGDKESYVHQVVSGCLQDRISLGGIATGQCWEPFLRNWDRL